MVYEGKDENANYIFVVAAPLIGAMASGIASFDTSVRIAVFAQSAAFGYLTRASSVGGVLANALARLVKHRKGLRVWRTDEHRAGRASRL